MRYLLDTNICIYIRDKKPAKVLARFDQTMPGDLGMSVITFGELTYGAFKNPIPGRLLSDLTRFASLIPILPLPERAGETYGIIRAELAAKGNNIGPNDLWTAAHALASKLTLVTNNEREFRRVEGLRIENWTK